MKTTKNVIDIYRPEIGEWRNNDIEEAMKHYAMNVAIAVRSACIDKYNTSGGNDFEVANIDLKQFVK